MVVVHSAQLNRAVVVSMEGSLEASQLLYQTLVPGASTTVAGLFVGMESASW
jgi:hypothetical protein